MRRCGRPSLSQITGGAPLEAQHGLSTSGGVLWKMKERTGWPGGADARRKYQLSEVRQVWTAGIRINLRSPGRSRNEPT